MKPSVFTHGSLRMDAVDLENDPPRAVVWTYSPAMAVRFGDGNNLPRGEVATRKTLEGWGSDKKSNTGLVFALRRQEDDGLWGFLHFRYIAWIHGLSMINVIHDPEATERLGDALTLAARYAFEELNLHVLNFAVGEDAQALQQALTAAGAKLCVRQREAIYRDGRYQDRLWFNLLAREWICPGEKEMH